MPKAIAETDPYKQIENAIGSGPFKFRKEMGAGHQGRLRQEHGLRAAQGAGAGAAGGKIAKVDRVEWLYIPDPTTCMNA